VRESTRAALHAKLTTSPWKPFFFFFFLEIFFNLNLRYSEGGQSCSKGLGTQRLPHA